MASKQYRTGSMYEYQIAWYLRMCYFYVIRAYASQGVADLIAVPPANPRGNRTSMLIQAKATKRGAWVDTLERDRLSYLASYTGGEVVLAWKDGKVPVFRDWETGEDFAPGDYLNYRYGIVGADWRKVHKNLRAGKKPLHLHPPPVDERGKVISAFQDVLDTGSWSPVNPFLHKLNGVKKSPGFSGS